MKKWFTLILCLLLGTLSLQANKFGKGIVEAGKKAARQAERIKGKMPKKAPKAKPTPKPARIPRGTTSAGRGATRTAPEVKTPSAKAPVGRSSVPSAARKPHGSKPYTPNPPLRERLTSEPVPSIELSETWETLKGEHAQLLAEQETLAFHADYGRSVVFASLENREAEGFTVTIIKTNYEGNEEIFGVIATHVLPGDTRNIINSLQRTFEVQVPQAGGEPLLVPAEVVQIAPQSMLDISLVKFPKEAESLLVPLELAEGPAAIDEVLFSYGFADAKPSSFNRTVQNTSFVSIRTDLSLEGLRYGYCGSPLLNIEGKVKAIHTGTKEGKDGTRVSYGTHASHIKTLIDAYHSNGVKEYEFVIKEQPVMKLETDEYISAVYLFNANGKRILMKNFEDKFSESFVTKALEEHPDAAYMQMTTRKALWVDEGNHWILEENRGKTDKTKKQHWYDLQTHEILPERPAGIVM